ncbi:MAG: aminotransferase class V-fold PLP-dependent enzyme, partial [Actinomycetia bacterium]|nr:aminotransferase class V-fold PLP-dependent enzyme [Actinomycetes bacterium]
MEHPYSTADEIIYLDNAATSWPKPGEVCKAMIGFQVGVGASPGRSGHRLSIEAGRIVYRAREVIAALFNL